MSAPGFEAEGYGPGGTCPYCGARAETAAEEVAHMEARHPGVIDRRLREAGLPPQERPADRLAALDQWAEAKNANVMLARRLDLTCPDEWSCILTWAEGDELRQAKGSSMSPALAVERALDNAREEVPA